MLQEEHFAHGRHLAVHNGCCAANKCEARITQILHRRRGGIVIAAEKCGISLWGSTLLHVHNAWTGTDGEARQRVMNSRAHLTSPGRRTCLNWRLMPLLAHAVADSTAEIAGCCAVENHPGQW